MATSKKGQTQKIELETVSLEALASRLLPESTNKAINEVIVLEDDGRSYITILKEEDSLRIEARIRASKSQIIKLIISIIVLTTAHSAPQHLDIIKTVLLNGGG